jgi:hypothetical protein
VRVIATAVRSQPTLQCNAGRDTCKAGSSLLDRSAPISSNAGSSWPLEHHTDASTHVDQFVELACTSVEDLVNTLQMLVLCVRGH